MDLIDLINVSIYLKMCAPACAVQFVFLITAPDYNSAGKTGQVSGLWLTQWLEYKPSLLLNKV